MPKPYEQFTNIVDLIRYAQNTDQLDYYLKMDELQDGYAYKIIARNAYVGIWRARTKAFVISRYKFALKPFMCKEYHWDADPRFGTAKPLELIEKAPFDSIIKRNEKKITAYLDTLEQQHPLIEGMDTVVDRRNAVVSYQERQKIKIETVTR